MPYISPSNTLNKRNTFNSRTTKIQDYKNYGGKHLENSCSGVNKNYINKNNNSGNTLQKLRVNNPLRIIVGRYQFYKE